MITIGPWQSLIALDSSTEWDIVQPMEIQRRVAVSSDKLARLVVKQVSVAREDLRGVDRQRAVHIYRQRGQVALL